MPGYKKQHFLPLAYLGQFARPPDVELRKREMWRVSATHAGSVPVKTQCQEDYFYSRANAALCENYFGQIEGIYGSLIAAIKAGRTLNAFEMFRFFLCAVDFYARGFKFRVETETEEMNFYLHRIDIFKQHLIGGVSADASEDAHRDHILKNWDFNLIPFRKETAVLTSDSPSVWFGTKRAPEQLSGVLMPVTPMCCFVGVDREHYRIEAKLGSADDAHTVSVNEIENCVDAVFFSDPLSDVEIETIRRRLSTRNILVPRTDGWLFELIDYDENPNLSFIKVR